MEQQSIVAIGIFLITYGLIIAEKIHRTIVAMLGGIVMLVVGIVDQATAIHHIDFNTLGLLIGMMIIVAITGETGVFKYMAIKAAKKAGGDPLRILLAIGIITAASSAFLDNVTTVLLMVPVSFSITRVLGVNPEPYLITMILTSNIGGTATLIGDPPNIMIGSAVKELSFIDFINNLALISAVILLATMAALALLYRNSLYAGKEAKEALMNMNEAEALTDRALLRKCLVILSITISGFFLHQALHLESATISLTTAFILLLITVKGDHDLEHAFQKIEWTTIFFFAGLFVLVSGLIETKVISALAQQVITFTQGDLTTASIFILWLSAIASAFVDNIPFVATMIPLIKDMGVIIPNLEPLWWSLALGACLGGNGSLIGASANLIVAGLASQEGHNLSFVKFLKIGFPITILSIILSTAYIYIRYL